MEVDSKVSIASIALPVRKESSYKWLAQNLVPVSMNTFNLTLGVILWRRSFESLQTMQTDSLIMHLFIGNFSFCVLNGSSSESYNMDFSAISFSTVSWTLSGFYFFLIANIRQEFNTLDPSVIGRWYMFFNLASIASSLIDDKRRPDLKRVLQ